MILINDIIEQINKKDKFMSKNKNKFDDFINNIPMHIEAFITRVIIFKCQLSLKKKKSIELIT